MDNGTREDRGAIGRGIVVGYDGSPGAEVALEWAAAASSRDATPLTVVHCVEMSAIPIVPIMAVDALPPEIRDDAQAVLDRGVERARAAAPSSVVRGVLVIGTAAAELVLASKDAALVVVGSRGRGRVAAGLLGSVSYATAAHSLCPVVVVRGDGSVQPDSTHAVVVGVDDSEASHHAVSMAATVASRAGAPLRLATVGHLRSPEGWAYVEDSKAGTEHSHAVREQVQPILDAARERAVALHPELEVESEVLYGDAGHVLAELGSRAGLLVVGSRGRGGFAGLLLGSVSHTAVHEAQCPVMVVR